MPEKYVKASSDRKRYQISYVDWLDTGELVSLVTFSVSNNTLTVPLVVNDVQVLPSGLGVQYYVSGGEEGVTYRILADLETNIGPQKKLDEVLMTIREP